MHQIEGAETGNRNASAQAFKPPSCNHPQANTERKEHKQRQLERGKMRQMHAFSEGEQEHKADR